ncbi:MAG: DUF3156 family protein [Acidimicrobiia bacterium]
MPTAGGLVLDVASRAEKRFLGRTEIAVFETHYKASLDDTWSVELKHTGGLKRTGINGRAASGERAEQIAEFLAGDEGLTAAALPLDFTRFEVHGDVTGSMTRVELMGASHVAIALPPMRSYVRLYDDQREALLSTLAELGRALDDLATRTASPEPSG